LMTGLHALHVIGGMGALTVATVRAVQGGYGAAHHTPLELIVLYWHLVDVIWIFLWPLLYLVG
jgi:cytochrome c oxidase subunit III